MGNNRFKSKNNRPRCLKTAMSVNLSKTYATMDGK